jgi:hypothetical protein
MSSRTIFWALPLGLSLAFAACSDDEPTDQGGGNVVTPGGTPGGAGGTTGAAPGGAGGTTGGAAGAGGTTGGVAGAGGTTGGVAGAGGTTSGAAGAGGTTGGVAGAGGTTSGGATGGTAGTGGTGGTAGGTNNFVKCDTKGDGPNLKACGSFVGNEGVELQLGPYGGQMEPNVGQGFETTVSILDGDLACATFIAVFNEDPEASERLNNISNLKLELHTIYKPAVMPPGKMPIVSWGNGTCSQPEGYGALLRYIASHGILVIAPNNRYVGDGSPQRKAIDFAFAMNMDSKSPFYQKLDTDKVIAMGHSQGGAGTAAASSDPRIKSVILFNGGTSASKPFLAISGDMDIQGGTAADWAGQVNGSSQSKAAWMWFHKIVGTGGLSGHLTLMTQPERVAAATVAWIKYTLLDDAESKTYFAGSNCKLCNMAADVEFGQKGIN